MGLKKILGGAAITALLAATGAVISIRKSRMDALEEAENKAALDDMEEALKEEAAEPEEPEKDPEEALKEAVDKIADEVIEKLY